MLQKIQPDTRVAPRLARSRYAYWHACWAALLLTGCGFCVAEDGPIFDIPKLAEIKVDGKSDDWGDKGFRVETLCDVAGRTRPPQDFDVSFRLGWDDLGLRVLVNVIDDVPLEPAEKLEDLWQGDSIEFFVATQRGADQSYQVVVAPGRDPKKPELRSNISDYRKGDAKKEKLTIEAARTVTDKGYVLEVLLPWKNLGIQAKEGTEFAFQLYANDVDKENERFQALWYPRPDAHSDTKNTQRLRLAGEKGSAPELFAASTTVDADGKLQVTLVGPDSFNAKTVALKNGDKSVVEAALSNPGGRSSAKLTLPKLDPAATTLNAALGGGVKESEHLCTIIVPEQPK